MTTRTRLVATAVLGLVLTLLCASPALAAEGDAAEEVSWGVQPSSPTGPDGRDVFDYQVAPGTVVSDWFAVTNRSTQPATFHVYAADATTDYDSASFTLIGSDQASDDLGAWTSVDGAPATCTDAAADALPSCLARLGITLELGPGERADIPFILTVPHGASPGDHAGGIVAVHTSATAGEGGANVVRENRVGTRIYLRVDGPVSAGLAVTGVVSGYDGSWNPVGGGTATTGFDLVNAGNVRLSAEPTVRLTGPFGIPLGDYTLPAVENLMPGSSAHVSAELAGIPPLLLVFADIAVEPLPAQGIASPTDALPARVVSSTTAWAVPWSLIGIVVLVGGGVALTIWLRRRARRHLAEDLADYADQIRADALKDHPSGERAPAAERAHAMHTSERRESETV
ncbi:hypothetical protein [Microbacterium sp. CPCC 204701]|uniref:hypothetical protein n=1 Tax=Microbacterium sp. CPCC 204701 TaxID=2493084 RepID=UPI000FDCBA0B|nr:hypothetical protein [Microbacterium sp. CPCC 204701]